MRILCGVILLSLSFHVSSAQLLQNLKKAAGDKAKTLATKENLSKAGNLALKRMDNVRAEFDSADFDYAILVSDNAGLFDVKDKGETIAKISSAAGYVSALNKNAELSNEENARFKRETGELYYGSRKYQLAETSFLNAKKLYEDGGLTENFGYVKTLSNLGLLYATMGRFTQAEGLTAEALDIRKTKLGENNIGVAASLNNYGVLRYNQASYNDSEKDLAN